MSFLWNFKELDGGGAALSALGCVVSALFFKSGRAQIGSDVQGDLPPNQADGHLGIVTVRV